MVAMTNIDQNERIGIINQILHLVELNQEDPKRIEQAVKLSFEVALARREMANMIELSSSPLHAISLATKTRNMLDVANEILEDYHIKVTVDDLECVTFATLKSYFGMNASAVIALQEKGMLDIQEHEARNKRLREEQEAMHVDEMKELLRDIFGEGGHDE